MLYRKLLQILITLVILFFLAEIGLRILSKFYAPLKFITYSKHEQIDIEGAKSLADLFNIMPINKQAGSNLFGFIINSKNFRTPEYQEEKIPGTYRIVFIGDSFTRSSGPLPYPYHFTAVFGEMLKSALKNEKFEIINLGVNGVGPKFEKRVLQLEGIKLKPDLVVLQFFVGNDFVDDYYHHHQHKLSLKEKILLKSYLMRTLDMGRKIFFHFLSLEHSYGLLFKKSRPGTYIGSLHDYKPNKPTFRKGDFLNLKWQRMVIFFHKSFPAKNWKMIQRDLLEIKKVCESHGAQLVVMIIPDEVQINQSLLNEIVSRRNKKISDLEVDLPQQIMDGFLKANGFYYLDLLPVFKEEGKKQTLYFLQDSHWNREGNLLGAEELFFYLVKNKLVLTGG
jgi:hypothetical protein